MNGGRAQTARAGAGTRDHLIDIHAPEQAAALASLAEQQKFAAQMRDTMLQTVADLIDLQKADEMMAAASAELA